MGSDPGGEAGEGFVVSSRHCTDDSFTLTEQISGYKVGSAVSSVRLRLTVSFACSIAALPRFDCGRVHERRMKMPGSDYAVFTELSPNTKAMTPGFNTRVFTDCDSQRGNAIRCDFNTGAISLSPGSYQINGFSMAAYNSGNEPPEMTTIRSPAAAGYCRLRIYDPARVADLTELRGIPNEDPAIICIGSPSTPNMTPSLFDAYYTAENDVQIILEHQMGHAPDGIYLRVYTQKSKWHAFARIAIRRI